MLLEGLWGVPKAWLLKSDGRVLFSGAPTIRGEGSLSSLPGPLAWQHFEGGL